MTDQAIPTRRRFLHSTVTLGTLAALPWGRAAAADCRTADGPWIPDEEFLAELPRIMQAFAVPGVGIAVVEDGKLAWSRGFGVRHALTGAPVDDRTVFEDASLSKPVFAYLVMRLADLGRIDLDRPLVRYRRPDYLAAHEWIELITARDVLRHTTGLPNWRAKPASEKLVPAGRPGTRSHDYGGATLRVQPAAESQ